MGNLFSAKDRRLILITLVTAIGAGATHFMGISPVVAFVVAGAALATLASLVGRSVEALGDRLGPSATGLLQSALGNLPEIFVIAFSLKAGLFDVVRATLVGSILANVLLVLGAAFVVGGIKHGRQSFGAEGTRTLGLMLMLSVFILAIPSLTSALHTPAATHERTITVVISILMLVLFGLSLPAALKKNEGSSAATEEAAHAASETAGHGQWPLALAVGMLAVTGLGAAFVSEWFVAALEPAIETLGISQAFAGLVIVAIAGNAVENFVGVQLAAKNQMDYAVQVILQSPVQIALTVGPIIALAAGALGQSSFTLVLPPLLLASLFMAALVAVLVTFDGESNWFEGAVLICLYAAIATAFWWG